MNYSNETPEQRRKRFNDTIAKANVNHQSYPPNKPLDFTPPKSESDTRKNIRLKEIKQDIREGIALAYKPLDPIPPPGYKIPVWNPGYGPEIKDNPIIMIEPQPNSLSELCTPPYSIAWRIYNNLAGKIDCSCCVFWRGFILSTLFWLWTAISLAILFLIYGK
jgi:hypothetical protein